MVPELEPSLLPERLPGEGGRAYQALLDFLAMSPGERSVRGLTRLYAQRHQSDTKATPPTRRPRTLRGWSSRFRWVARAAGYDEAVARELEAARLEAEKVRLAANRETRQALVGRLAALSAQMLRFWEASEAERDGLVTTGAAVPCTLDELRRSLTSALGEQREEDGVPRALTLKGDPEQPLQVDLRHHVAPAVMSAEDWARRFGGELGGGDG